MPNHALNPEDCYYFLEEQIHNPVPDSFELLPTLRVRFGNLLREEIVSVRLEYACEPYEIAVTSVDDQVTHKLIDAFIPENLRVVDLFEHSKLNRLLPVITAWIEALDRLDAAREFELFTPHALALIERISSDPVYMAEQNDNLGKAENAQAFYLALAQEMAKESAPAGYQKVEAAVRKIYKSRPGNGMVGDECETEWQELGAMLLDSEHMLLEVGIHQLQLTVAGEIEALSRSERLAIWLGHCGYIGDYVSDNSPDESFDLSDDSFTLEEIVESIARDLQREMVWDWEKKLSEMEDEWHNDEDETDV